MVGVGAIFGAAAMGNMGAAAPLESAAQPSRNLVALRDKLREMCSEYEPQLDQMPSAYRSLFHRRKAVHVIERTQQISYLGLKPHERVTEPDADAYEGFVWNHVPQEVYLAFAVSPETKDEDIPQYFRDLINAFHELREVDAAEVLNHAMIYNPTVGGDGQPICSTQHPHDTGTWSNTFGGFRPLTEEAMLEATVAIRNNWVDGRGVNISARAEMLVAPKALWSAVDKFPGGYVASEQLTDPDSWFIKTSVDGLVWCERAPFEMDVWIDTETDSVLVKGYERRCFGCTDPRAVFGSVKPGKRRDLAHETRLKYQMVAA